MFEKLRKRRQASVKGKVPDKLVPGRGTLAQRLRAREQGVSIPPAPTATVPGGVATMIMPKPDVNIKTQADPNTKGTIGTPIQSDRGLHSQTQSSGNTRVLTGKSPGDYQMVSGTTLTRKAPPTPRSQDSEG